MFTGREKKFCCIISKLVVSRFICSSLYCAPSRIFADTCKLKCINIIKPKSMWIISGLSYRYRENVLGYILCTFLTPIKICDVSFCVAREPRMNHSRKISVEDLETHSEGKFSCIIDRSHDIFTFTETP